MSPLSSSTKDEITQDLVPALIKCFGIIFVGYIFGRFQILPNHERKGLGIFVQNLALPVLIFNLVARISFESVNWTFLASVFVAKTMIFLAVAVLSLILIRPIHIGKAGLYAIAATQSNDFALGYPLLVSLYQKDHSSYSSFLYLTAPIQILLLNPAGFFMLEMYKQTQDESYEKKKNAFVSVLKGIFSNPIIAMTVLGIIWNVSYGNTVPLPVAQMIDAISSAFPATALFLLGHSMAGKISSFRGYFVLTPLLLTLAKNLILPIVLQRIVVGLTRGLNVQETQDLSSFGFLYGTIPCAPATFVFACQYALSVDVIASSIIFSTLSSAPIMFVSATMATLSPHGFEKVALYMESTIGYISALSLISCFWLLVVFAMSRKWHSASYRVTIYLFLAQLVTSVGGVLCFSRNTDSESIIYAQYVMTSAGILCTRMWTVVLAVHLLLSKWKGVDFILKVRYSINIGGFVATLSTAFLLAGSLISCKTPTANSNPNFQLGYPQILLTSVITLLCLIMTVVSLMSQHKYGKMGHPDQNCETSKPLIGKGTQAAKSENERNIAMNYGSSEFQSNGEIHHCLSNEDNNDRSCSSKSEITDAEDVGNDFTVKMTCGTEQGRLSGDEVELYQNLEADPQEDSRILRHIILLVILSLSMLVTFSLCLWKLLLEATNGIFVELEFLDIALNYGQGIICFLIFGLDATLLTPFVKLRQYIHCWNPFLSTRRNLSLAE